MTQTDENGAYQIHPAEDPDAVASDHPLGAPEDQPGIEAVCAFMMIQGLDGRWIAHFDMNAVGPLSVQRPAHRYDALGGFEAVKADILAGITAETSVQAQMQIAQQLAQQQQAQAIAEKLHLGPKGFRS